MSDLPAEVIADILSRLPAKPLLRFRCVSKPWLSLIDSPDFIKSHLNRSIESNSNLNLILRDSWLYSVDLDLLDRAVVLDHPLKSRNYGTEVMGSCNGLLCLSNTEENNVIWNPSTRKHRKLPVTPIEFPREFGICQFIIYGFGCDFENDDYKVVRIVQFYGRDDDSFDSEVKVYSLKSNSWRRITDFPYYLRYKRAYGMLASGALHWVVSRKPESDTANLIAAFDLGSEEYRLVPQPEYSDKDFHMNVGVLGGCLCVLCNYLLDHVDVWVMKDYGVKESWVKLFSVVQPTVMDSYKSFEYVRPIAYSKSGGQVLLEQDTKMLVWYDLEKETIRNVKIHGMPDSLEADVCWASLVSLGGDGGSGEKKMEQAQEKRKKKKIAKRRDRFLSEGFKLVL